MAENRKAFHDYHTVETFEAGMVLVGTEVKAIREGNANLRDSFARLEDGERSGFTTSTSTIRYDEKNCASPKERSPAYHTRETR
ncbi:MAG: SsrA-binding protein [Acidobacteria bacterium]|nr:SsrA-binding protein [Acidobacteriota bacterium]